ncbi:uncharacterized protein LOC124193702 isoform X2 [Daphnia pulex]|uniref:uncharacterized protein LOC124193702 isoform X2 n=1 Tax=Daphnia pulex TaxID=6669 RepID=UPI001EDE0F49|nr:uncharacterized protein LOC124193702 isoform X2 [Daphnia pulex]
MSDSAGMNENDLFEGGESKSSSQESGLCSTMMAIDESMGSLEELSDNLHQHLSTHIDHASVLQYELDMLRSQLTEKNRLISTQQVTIKQLQDALNTTQKELTDLRKAAEMELMNQNRVLSEIRDDDAALVEKVAQLEKKLRKTGQTVSTQTESPQRLSENNSRQTSGSLKTSPAPPFNSPPSYYHRDRVTNIHYSAGPFHGETGDRRDESCSPQLTRDIHGQVKSSPTQQRPLNESRSDTQQFPWSQFQDLLSEVRQIQKLLQSTGERKTSRDTPATNIRTDDLTGFWNTITEERQQRLQLDHCVRQMELDVLEVKTQVQSCKARLQNEQPPPVSPSMRWNCCPLKCCGSSSHQAVKHCCSCAEDFPIPHPKLRTSSSLFTLV